MALTVVEPTSTPRKTGAVRELGKADMRCLSPDGRADRIEIGLTVQSSSARVGNTGERIKKYRPEFSPDWSDQSAEKAKARSMAGLRAVRGADGSLRAGDEDLLQLAGDLLLLGALG